MYYTKTTDVEEKSQEDFNRMLLEEDIKQVEYGMDTIMQKKNVYVVGKTKDGIVKYVRMKNIQQEKYFLNPEEYN